MIFAFTINVALAISVTSTIAMTIAIAITITVVIPMTDDDDDDDDDDDEDEGHPGHSVEIFFPDAKTQRQGERHQDAEPKPSEAAPGTRSEMEGFMGKYRNR